MNLYISPNAYKFDGMYGYFNKSAITTGEGATINRSNTLVTMSFPVDVKPNANKLNSAILEISGTGLTTSNPVETKVVVKFVLDDGSTVSGWTFDNLNLNWSIDSVSKFFDFVSPKQGGLSYTENILFSVSTSTNTIDFSNWPEGWGTTIGGGSGNDTIYGGHGSDNINGMGGNNTLYGNDGDDVLMAVYGGSNQFYGGNGDDIIYAGDGTETYSGGSGTDTLILSNINWGVSTLSVYSTDADSKIKFIDGTHTVTIDRVSDIEIFQFKNGVSKSLSQIVTTYPVGQIPAYAPPPIITYETHSLSVIVDKGVLGKDAVLLKGLVERLSLSNSVVTSQAVEYAGNTFEYAKIDSLITTVTRDGEFTSEFKKEITDIAPSALNLSYKDAVALIGMTNIDATLLSIAGLDGNFVG